MSDPSFLVSNPTRSDASLAPEGRESYYVFFPTPNTTADIDWTVERARYRDEVLATLERRGYVGFTDAIEVEHAHRPVRLATSGHEPRLTVRVGAFAAADRAVPAQEPVGRQHRLRWVRHDPRGRRSHGADLGPPGCRTHHRT